MKRAIVRLGDTTTHGGTVLESFRQFNVYGRTVAGVGHRGHCPHCKRDFVIVVGVRHFSYFGVNVAVEGMATSCGALLIASQHQASMDDPTLTSQALESMFATATLEEPAEASTDELEYYFLVSRSDGPPPRLTYRIDSSGRKLHEGRLDASGSTIAFPTTQAGTLTSWMAPE